MSTQSSPPPLKLPEEVRAINVGLQVFGEAIRAQGGTALDVDWRIPGGGRQELVEALKQLHGSLGGAIDEANREACRRLDEAAPLLVRVGVARRELPAMADGLLLHPGPPLGWDEFCDPLQRSARAAIIAEGWASSPEEADRLAARGEVHLEPANEHAAVVPMATILGPSAPVLVVENPAGGNRAFSAINQGPGRTAWLGVDMPESVERLGFLRDVVAPVLDRLLTMAGPLDVFSLAAQGLMMGDDVHLRSQASTNLLIRHLLPHLAALDDRRRVPVAKFLSANHLFFLNVAMAAAKAAVEWAAEVQGASVVTAMARNGTTFGIRVGALGRAWFLAPAPPVADALFHPGYGEENAARDIGDSAVLELVGLGAAAAAASPALAAFAGGGMAGAIASTEAMERICSCRSTRFKLPFLDFRGSPVGVDIRRVVESEVTPPISTGILHASEGLGQIGAGIARAPIECFQRAALALVAARDRNG